MNGTTVISLGSPSAEAVGPENDQSALEVENRSSGLTGQFWGPRLIIAESGFDRSPPLALDSPDSPASRDSRVVRRPLENWS